jgi:hypothetical protein
MPYWPLSRRQLPITRWREPAIMPAPPLRSMVLSWITQPSPESWFTTPSLGGGSKLRMVSPRIVTSDASNTNAYLFTRLPSRTAPGAPR